MTEREVAEELPKVKFIYNMLPSFELNYINGVIGGLTPRGDIICNFFFEYKELPNFEENIIEADQLKPLPVETSSTDVLRQIKCGIIVNPNQAEKIAGSSLFHVGRLK